MDCNEVQTKVVHFMEGELPPHERVAVQAHLSRCYICREELDEVGKTLELCRQALRHPRPRGRFDELVSRVASARREEHDVAHRPRLRMRHVVRGMAAVAAVFLLFSASYPTVRGTGRFMAALEDPARFCDEASLEQWESSFLRPALVWRLRIEREAVV